MSNNNESKFTPQEIQAVISGKFGPIPAELKQKLEEGKELTEKEQYAVNRKVTKIRQTVKANAKKNKDYMLSPILRAEALQTFVRMEQLQELAGYCQTLERILVDKGIFTMADIDRTKAMLTAENFRTPCFNCKHHPDLGKNAPLSIITDPPCSIELEAKDLGLISDQFPTILPDTKLGEKIMRCDKFEAATKEETDEAREKWLTEKANGNTPEDDEVKKGEEEGCEHEAGCEHEDIEEASDTEENHEDGEASTEGE